MEDQTPTVQNQQEFENKLKKTQFYRDGKLVNFFDYKRKLERYRTQVVAGMNYISIYSFNPQDIECLVIYQKFGDAPPVVTKHKYFTNLQDAENGC